MKRILGLGLWIAYFVLPLPTGGWVGGLPLGPIEAAALLAIGWFAWRRKTLHGTKVVAALLAIRAVLALALPFPHGLRARYFANDNWQPPVERSVDFRRFSWTRIDPRIDFAPSSRELPLWFFNDIERFNFYEPNQPDRTRLAFSTIWDGYWWIDRGRSVRTIYLDVPGAAAQLTLDGVTAIAVNADEGVRTTEVPIGPGWRRLEIRLASPYGAPRRVSAGEISGSGRRRPFGDSLVAVDRVDAWRVTAARLVEPLVTGVDALVLGWLAVLMLATIRDELRAFSRESDLGLRRQMAFALVALVVMAEAMSFAVPSADRLVLLGGGGDPMTYEFDARDILLNGPLMNRRLAIGQGEAFYYQPLYAYFLAACHAAFGEGMFGALLIQRLLSGLLVWVLVEIAVAVGGSGVWSAAFLSAGVFAYAKVAPLAGVLLSESLFLPLLGIWTLGLVAVMRCPGWGRVAGVGAVGGFTALSRSTTVLAWPVVLVTLLMAWKGRTRALTLVMLLVSCATVGLATARNWVVARKLVPITTSLPVNLFVGNEPPATLKIDLSSRQAIYDRFGLQTHTRLVAEYARALPRDFAAHLGRKALYTLGFFEAFVPGRGYSSLLITIWMLAVGGLVSRHRRHAPVRGLPAWIAATQFAVVVVFFPHIYGDRLILPFYLLLVPYAAIALSDLWSAIVSRLAVQVAAAGRPV